MDNINEGILKFWLIFEKLLNLKVKGIMSLILVIFFKVFVLKVNIYLQNMSITRRLARFDKTNVYFRGFCVCSLSLKIIIFYMSQFPNYMRNGTDAYTSATFNPSFNPIQQSCW